MVDAAEDPEVTTGYTDYFPADGDQTTLTIRCVGAAEIQKCKEQFLVNGRQLVVSLLVPVPANKSWRFFSSKSSEADQCNPLLAFPQHNFCRLQQRDFDGLRGPRENGADVPCAD